MHRKGNQDVDICIYIGRSVRFKNLKKIRNKKNLFAYLVKLIERQGCLPPCGEPGSTHFIMDYKYMRFQYLKG